MILLAEAGEEGAPDVGAQFMADNHLDAINAEYCLAEGGGVVRTGGQIRQANIGTTEKEPRFVEIIARGPAGHGSVPSRGNAVTRLSAAVGKIAEWTPPLRINETTGAYFKKLATMVPADVAKIYRDILNPDPKVSKAASDWLLENQPNHWSMVHTSLVPTIIDGGFRYNVIPSEAKATVDVRLHPDEDQSAFLDMVRKVVNDPERRSALGPRALSAGRRRAHRHRGLSRCSKRKPRSTTTRSVLPTMGVGATDMSNLRAKGIQCYGIGPGARLGGRRQGLRRAQRSGAHPRERAASIRAVPVRRRPRAGARQVSRGFIGVALNRGWSYREQVGPEHAGQTVLSYLTATRRHSTERDWAARIERGEVEVEGLRVQREALLRRGQTVAWHRPPWDEAAAPAHLRRRPRG